MTFTSAYLSENTVLLGAILLIAISLAAMGGYLIARRQFRQELNYKLSVYRNEMARLRRKAGASDLSATRATTEYTRLRSRVIRAHF